MHLKAGFAMHSAIKSRIACLIVAILANEHTYDFFCSEFRAHRCDFCDKTNFEKITPLLSHFMTSRSVSMATNTVPLMQYISIRTATGGS